MRSRSIPERRTWPGAAGSERPRISSIPSLKTRVQLLQSSLRIPGRRFSDVKYSSTSIDIANKGRTPGSSAGPLCPRSNHPHQFSHPFSVSHMASTHAVPCQPRPFSGSSSSWRMAVTMASCLRSHAPATPDRFQELDRVAVAGVHDGRPVAMYSRSFDGAPCCSGWVNPSPGQTTRRCGGRPPGGQPAAHSEEARLDSPSSRALDSSSPRSGRLRRRRSSSRASAAVTGPPTAGCVRRGRR